MKVNQQFFVGEKVECNGRTYIVKATHAFPTDVREEARGRIVMCEGVDPTIGDLYIIPNEALYLNVGDVYNHQVNKIIQVDEVSKAQLALQVQLAINFYKETANNYFKHFGFNAPAKSSSAQKASFVAKQLHIDQQYNIIVDMNDLHLQLNRYSEYMEQTGTGSNSLFYDVYHEMDSLWTAFTHDAEDDEYDLFGHMSEACRLHYYTLANQV